jgi:CRISPR/Cas system-associated protein Cas5 (RAMP superfamily)
MSFLSFAIEKAREFLSGNGALIYERRLQAFAKLPGAERKLRELSHASKSEFSDLLKEVDYALVFKRLGFEVEVEPDIGSEEAKKIDLKLNRDGQECFVEVTRFRRMYQGPSEFREGMDEILLEYGNGERDTEKAAQKIVGKVKQLGSRTSIIAIWNDDEDLEELEVEFAVKALIEGGFLPEGLQFILFGSPWIGRKQFYCFPARTQLAPVFRNWIADIEEHFA